MDLFLTHEGDLALTTLSELQTTLSTRGEQLQAVGIRVKTKLGYSQLRPLLGSRLDQLVGALLTKETLAMGEKYLQEALANSPLLTTVDVSVRGVPVGTNTALFLIMLNGGETRYLIPFDFTRGIVEPRGSGALGSLPS